MKTFADVTVFADFDEVFEDIHSNDSVDFYMSKKKYHFKGNGFVPKYNWFENGEQISLRVEIPGNYTISCGKIKNSGE